MRASCVAGARLPSWNDGPAKQSIVDFVAKGTKEGSPDFVPVAERIASPEFGASAHSQISLVSCAGAIQLT